MKRAKSLDIESSYSNCYSIYPPTFLIVSIGLAAMYAQALVIGLTNKLSESLLPCWVLERSPRARSSVATGVFALIRRADRVLDWGMDNIPFDHAASAPRALRCDRAA
jgi:hypothetical protein